jgi:chromosomal replication initiation ATPase DnaA
LSQAHQYTLDFDHRPSLSGDAFLVVPGNQAAIDWIDLWPNWPHPALAISGPRGSGKTHLSHVFISLSNATPINLKTLNTADIRPVVSDHPALVLDDIEEIAGTDAEETLFHLLNVISEENRFALLSSGTPPARWAVQLPDLRSRLNAIPHVSIEPPDDDLMAALVVKLFGDRQLQIDSGIIEYILARIERSFDGIRATVAQIDDTALRERRNITIPLIKRVLDDMTQPADQ